METVSKFKLALLPTKVDHYIMIVLVVGQIVKLVICSRNVECILILVT